MDKWSAREELLWKQSTLSNVPRESPHVLMVIQLYISKILGIVKEEVGAESGESDEGEDEEY